MNHEEDDLRNFGSFGHRLHILYGVRILVDHIRSHWTPRPGGRISALLG
jgi:hypothetical protein